MKKLIFSIAALAMIFATSCKKESVNEPETVREPTADEFCAEIESGSVQQKMRAVNAGGMSTKTHFGGIGDRSVIWDGNDAIYVNGPKNKFTCAVEEGTRAYFTRVAEPKAYQAAEYHAFYGPVTPDTNAASGTFSATQIYDATHQSNNLPMYAHSTNHWLTFKNICGVLKIGVPNAVSSADEIVVIADADINGTFTIDNSGVTPKMVINNVTSTLANKSIKLTGTFVSGDTVYVAIPAGSYKLNIQFKKNGQMTMETGVSGNTYTVNVNEIHKVVLPTVQPTAPEDCFCFIGTTTDSCTISIRGHCSSGAEGSFDVHCYLDYTLVRSNGTVYQGTFLNGSNKPGYSSYYAKLTVTPITIGKDDKLYIFATKNSTNVFCKDAGTSNKARWHEFTGSGTGKCDISGNILYIINQHLDTAESNYNNKAGVIFELFRDNLNLENAKDLVLPSSTPSSRCYYYMFRYCSNLLTAPTLPALTLGTGCYQGMFQQCTSLHSVTLKAKNNLTATDAFTCWLDGTGSKSKGTIHTNAAGVTYFNGNTASKYGWTVSQDQ